MPQLWKFPVVPVTSDEISDHTVAAGMLREAIGGI
jgi:hypothetical protein